MTALGTGVALAHGSTGDVSPSGAGGSSGTEGQVQMPVNATLTWQLLSVLATQNNLGSNSTFTSRVGGANGNQIVTFTAGQTGTQTDSTDSDGLVGGSLIDIAFAIGSGLTHTLTVTIFPASVLTHAANATQLFGVANTGSGLVQALSTTTFITVGGNCNSNATEANVQFLPQFVTACTHLSANVSANASTGSSTITFRNNTGAGNQTITFATTITGRQTDSTHTDNTVVNQPIDYTFVTGAGGSLTLNEISCESQNGNRSGAAILGDGGASVINFGVTAYTPYGGTGGATTEANVQYTTQFPFTAKNLQYLVTQNSLNTGATTITNRSGASGLTCTVNFAAGVTGSTVDTTHTDSIAAGALIDFQIVNGGSSGTVTSTINAIQILLPAGVPPAAAPISTFGLLGVG